MSDTSKKEFRFRFALLRKILYRIVPIFALVLFIAAVVLLHHNLKQYHLRDIIQSLHEIRGNRILLSLGLTCLSYLVLSGYDIMALLYIKKTWHIEISP